MSTQDRPCFQTTSLEVVVQAAPGEVFAAVRDLAASLWKVDESDVVAAAPPSSLTHSVRLDGQVSCWLSWEIAAVDCGSSSVRLVHDEADLRPGPTPELGEVIAALNSRLVALGSQRSTGEVTP